MMNKSVIKSIFLSITVCLFIQTTVLANRVVYVPQQAAEVGVKSFAKEAVQKSAAVVTIGSLGYSAFEFIRALKYWMSSNKYNEQEMDAKSRTSLMRALVALCIAAATGTIATADLSTVNFNIQLDIVRLLELIFRSANNR